MVRKGESFPLSGFRRLNRRNSAQRRLLVSPDLTADEIPAAGGHRRFVPHGFSCRSIRSSLRLELRAPGRKNRKVEKFLSVVYAPYRNFSTSGPSGPASAENMPKGIFSGRFGPRAVHAAAADYSQGEYPLTIPSAIPTVHLSCGVFFPSFSGISSDPSCASSTAASMRAHPT